MRVFYRLEWFYLVLKLIDYQAMLENEHYLFSEII